MQVLQNWWLAIWAGATRAAGQGNVDTSSYLGVYLTLGLTSVAILGVRLYANVIGALASATALHAAMLSKVCLRLELCNCHSQ